jgi:hypothetical protein
MHMYGSTQEGVTEWALVDMFIGHRAIYQYAHAARPIGVQYEYAYAHGTSTRYKYTGFTNKCDP